MMFRTPFISLLPLFLPYLHLLFLDLLTEATNLEQIYLLQYRKLKM